LPLLVALWGLSGGSFRRSRRGLSALWAFAYNPVVLSLDASFMYLGFSLGAALRSPSSR